ncbi:hypothetical protein [Nitrosomonas sp. Is79A3]|uniref:hypothetical protein n=1 Tax=Nitrosomonas sp. (strain Is79A3) TaxID=261292 RepID=UPI0002DC88CA
MKNLETRIAKLETKHSDPVIKAFHELACKLAREQELPEPSKPKDLSIALVQLADYLPD